MADAVTDAILAFVEGTLGTTLCVGSHGYDLRHSLGRAKTPAVAVYVAEETTDEDRGGDLVHNAVLKVDYYSGMVPRQGIGDGWAVLRATARAVMAALYKGRINAAASATYATSKTITWTPLKTGASVVLVPGAARALKVVGRTATITFVAGTTTYAQIAADWAALPAAVAMATIAGTAGTLPVGYAGETVELWTDLIGTAEIRSVTPGKVQYGYFQPAAGALEGQVYLGWTLRVDVVHADDTADPFDITDLGPLYGTLVLPAETPLAKFDFVEFRALAAP